MISNMSSTNPDDLIRFISGYGSPEPPQSIEEIQGDFQLAGLSTLLNSYLSRIPKSKILDIGCGNGVLVAKLAEINAFKDYPNIEYIGFDSQDKLPGAFATVNKLMLHSRIKLLPTGIKWTEYATTPCIIIVRNVFHELKIDEAARLIHEICMSLPTNSVVLFQDMATLPIAEKMKAGWLGVHLAKIFEKGGIKANHTPDTSKRGVDVFLIEGQRHAPCKLTEKNIRGLLIAARKEQLGILSLKYETMEEKPENKLPLSRLTHDIAAISLALKQLGETWLECEMKDGQTVASTFSLAFSNLSNHELDELQKKFKYPEIKGFQNRGYHIDALDKFFRSGKAIFILKAGPYMGKKTVVWWALFQKLKHNRLPLFVNLKEGADIFSIMEDVAVQLGIGRFIDVEVLSSLQDLPTVELRIVISEALTPIAAKTILIVDGFENGIDPEGKIENKDIEWLIDFWSGLDKSKLIIETRLEVKQLPFERCQLEYMTTFPSIGQKKHLYTIQLLHELVPINYRSSNAEFGGYPLELLDALDNHPYFAYIAGTIIRNNPNSNCLKDQNFIEDLKSRLYETLFSKFGLLDIEKEIIYSLVLVKDSFPLKFIDMVTEDPNMTNRLLEKGLLLESSPGRFKPLGILRYYSKVSKDQDKSSQINQKWHLIFADVFKRLYNIESDPSLYRQAYYHEALAGNKGRLTAYHLPEISICADTWYKSKKFVDALWAYRKIQEKRILHPKEKMKIASCLIRTNKMNITEGQMLYNDLFRQFRNWSGAKNSYVASLLYIGGHANTALNTLLKIPEIERDSYWYLQSARCYKQLYLRDEAYNEFEEAILQAPTSKVWPIIQELIVFARETGDNEKEAEWLKYAWNNLKLRFDDIKINLGAFFERTDELSESEKLLGEVHQADPLNAYCILPLIKTLCKQNKTEDAGDILEKIPPNAYPTELIVYARIVYFKKLEQFSECEKLLLSLPINEKDRSSIHRWGQWADLFLTWSLRFKGKEKIDTAKRGLKFVKEILEERNVPAMMSCLELSKIIDDTELQENLKTTIHKVNRSYNF